MRFLLTADWGFYFYYALGILTLTRGMLLLLESTRGRIFIATPVQETASGKAEILSRKPVLIGCLVFILIGSALPLSERLVPRRDQPLSRETLVGRITAATPEARLGELQGLLQDADLVILQGRALYPRYYAAGEGEPGTAKLGYGPMPQARLVFPMVGDANSLVIINLAGSPVFFPHAADVILVATRSPTHLQARVILVESDGETEIYFAED
jgi:hypothetical protein